MATLQERSRPKPSAERRKRLRDDTAAFHVASGGDGSRARCVYVCRVGSIPYLCGR